MYFEVTFRRWKALMIAWGRGALVVVIQEGSERELSEEWNRSTTPTLIRFTNYLEKLVKKKGGYPFSPLFIKWMPQSGRLGIFLPSVSRTFLLAIKPVYLSAFPPSSPSSTSLLRITNRNIAFWYKAKNLQHNLKALKGVYE